MSAFQDKVALVTGAGSGIGEALARDLAARGARLAVCDVDGTRLASLAASLPSSQVVTGVVDVSDQAQVAAFVRTTVERYGVLHQMYNNAGVSSSIASVLDSAYADYQRVLGINLWGVIHGTKEALPHLIASGEGRLVNISSLNGLMAQAGGASYVTSKFGVRGFTESVRIEMLRDRLPVEVTVVHPGGVKTSILEGVQLGRSPAEDARRRAVYEDKLFTMTAEEASRRILAGVARGRSRITLGQTRLIDRLVRLAPAHYPQFVAAWDRRTF